MHKKHVKIYIDKRLTTRNKHAKARDRKGTNVCQKYTGMTNVEKKCNVVAATLSTVRWRCQGRTGASPTTWTIKTRPK